MYRIVVGEQHPGMFRGYRLEDLDDTDAAAVREGRMVLAAIGLEKQRRDGYWVRKADKINFVVPLDVLGEYPHFEEIADEETRFWASDMWGATLEVPAGREALWGRLQTPCTVIETETELYENGIKHTGYVLIRDFGGERRRVSAELLSVEASKA
ncbi:hypothetical protein [Streptomyces mobaraensis]|uniref:Uncharacterized protein n=1 Tax=Streptomyces mobaraensis TaxID=35621 RepID=A0A5N5W1F5_STRMB|nr:hypothetical protein [Streptomyces mobaraensis]KAB7835718.1 hypothetical protein FRZ00_26205 [Streptomyces mobaraensis]